MSKTCKKLLASALAAAMLITTFVSSFVVSAATTGTLTIEDTTITVGAEEAKVNFKLTFDAYVEAPHELATITANPALTIKDIALGDVTYETAPVDPEDPEIESPALKIKTDGINKNAGKVLFESGVDGAVKANEINFTVTFDTSAAEVGEYTVTAAIASTDINEADIVVNCDDTAKVIIEAAHECVAGTPVPNGDGTHNVPCIDPECDKLFAENVACTYENGFCSACGFPEPVVEPEVVYGTVDMNWNSTNASLLAYHKFDIDTFSYSKHYLIRTDYWNIVNASSDVSYTFNVKGSGFNLEWGDAGVPQRTGYVAVSNLSIANVAYSMDFIMTITYTDANGVKHIDTTEAYTTDNIAKINEIGTEKSDALIALINTWLAECGNGPVDVEKSESITPEFDMSCDVEGEIDMNWDSTNAQLTPFHYVAPSNFAYSKHYLIRGDYYNALASATDVTSGFIVSGNGFNVQWESDGLLQRTGYVEVTNMSISNLSQDILWTVYIKYTDSEGVVHLDKTQKTTNFMTMLNSGGVKAGESQALVDALNAFYNLWIAD